MKSNLIFLILSLFIVSKLIEAGGGSAECKERRDTCGSLVKPDSCSQESSGSSSSSNGGSSGSSGVSFGSSGSSATLSIIQSNYEMSTNESYVSEVTDEFTDEEVTEESSSSTSGVSSSNGISSGVTVEVSSSTGSVAESTGKVKYVSCDFTREMWNISLTLSSKYQLALQEWILQIESTFMLDCSLTEDELVVLIAYSLKNFSEYNSECWEQISYLQIGSWGYCIDFVYVAYEIQLEKASNIVELNSNNDCQLFDAMRNATNGNGEAESECEELISELINIFSMSGWSYEQKMAACYNAFQAAFESSSLLKIALKNCEIEGYGTLESFLDVCLIYERSTTLSTVIGGSTSNCVLLEELANCYANTSLTISVRNQVKQLHDKLLAYFSNTSDIAERLKYVSEQCYSFFELVGFNVQLVDSIELGSWGTIYDLIFVSNICSNYGCGSVDAGPGTEPTTVGTTTTETPANCNTATSLVTIQSDNTTILITTLQTQYNSWNSTLKTGFNSYFNQIKSYCYNKTLTSQQIAKACSKSLSNYNKNNVYQQSVVFNITISSWKGTIGEFVACF